MSYDPYEIKGRAMKTTGARFVGKPADAAERLTYDVPEAGRLLGLSRNGAYAAAKAGLIPVLNIGRRMLVPKAALHQMLATAGAERQRAGCIQDISALGSRRGRSGEGGPET
jgi:excisionase family DNA binding protein